MTIAVFLTILFGAALHASWNAVVKGGSDKLLTTVLIAAFAALIAAGALPFLPAPAPASWPFIAASTICQIIYFVLVAQTYRVADMSATYPLMRGTAPLIVTVVSVFLLGEALAPWAWLGIVVISVGILSMAISGGTKPSKGMGFALLNAVVIATYTLIDGAGVRLSGAPAAYTLWLSLATGIPLVGWTILTRRQDLGRYVRQNWHLGAIGGVGTLASYGLALWAMTLAPVAVVAALRETSILFGVAISALILHERPTPTRIAAACIVAAGAIILRLA